MNQLITIITEMDWFLIGTALIDTFNMMFFSLGLTTILGLPLGVLLFLTSPKQLLAHGLTYVTLSFWVNVFRSLPFIILLIVLIPFTKWIMGTSLGVKGVVVPLVVGAVPFFARLVETALREVDKGVIEAAQSMGTPLYLIVWRVLLPEARPSLIAGLTVTAVALVSYTAMAGVVGGGGLGAVSIRYGYQRFQIDIMIVTVLILLVLVQVIQMVGDYFVRRYSRK